MPQGWGRGPTAGGQTSLEKTDGWGMCQVARARAGPPAEQAGTSLYVQLCQSWGQGAQREVGAAGRRRPGVGSVCIKRARGPPGPGQAVSWPADTLWVRGWVRATPIMWPPTSPNREASWTFSWPQLTTCSLYRDMLRAQSTTTEQQLQADAELRAYTWITGVRSERTISQLMLEKSDSRSPFCRWEN